MIHPKLEQAIESASPIQLVEAIDAMRSISPHLHFASGAVVHMFDMDFRVEYCQTRNVKAALEVALLNATLRAM